MKKVKTKNSSISKFLLGVSAAAIGFATYTFIKSDRSMPRKEKLTLNKKSDTKLFI